MKRRKGSVEKIGVKSKPASEPYLNKQNEAEKTEEKLELRANENKIHSEKITFRDGSTELKGLF